MGDVNIQTKQKQHPASVYATIITYFDMKYIARLDTHILLLVIFFNRVLMLIIMTIIHETDAITMVILPMAMVAVIRST